MTTRTMFLNELSDEAVNRLLDRKIWNDGDTLTAAQRIVDDVRERGDAAVAEATARYDGVTLDPSQFRVPQEAFDVAASSLDATLKASLDQAIRNVERFHATQQEPGEKMLEVEPGVWCGERATPIDSVCLYVPRGRGAFSSVACMLAIPAKLAGVPRIVMTTPPGEDGSVDAATLYVAKKIGVNEIYRVGGAQAVAAVALGTDAIPKCDKIVGPGNIWVSAARQLLAREIDPGPPAGPSESLIVADGSADADNLAWNLLVEAEHGENSCALLVTDDADEAKRVAEAVESKLSKLDPGREAYAREVLSTQGGILVTDSLDASCEFANRFAAEHVALMVREPWEVLPKVRNAGEILLGDFPIMSLANYAMGINAVLPTGGWAKTSSGVSVRDFTKRTSIGFVTRRGFDSLREAVPPMSRDEGFSAHHLSIEEWR